MTTVIIPSAKIVPEELQHLGKLPAVIYPVNEGIVFDYLYQQYSHECKKIKIVCFENVDKVKRRIAKYDNSLIEITTLTEIRDLGHTIYNGISDEDKEIIINFGDTIVMESLQKLSSDSFYYSEDYRSDKWTYFEESNGKLVEIYDKTAHENGENEKSKLFVGVFRLSDAQLFKVFLKEGSVEKHDKLSTFYRALQLYSQHHRLNPLFTDNWFDIGHEDRYYNSTLEVKARDFNHISIDKNRGILRKSSDDIDKFIGEIKWYLKLPADIEYIRPRIFDYDVSYSSPYVTMEYYAYHTVHELFLYGDLTRKQWIDIFSRIQFVCNDLRRYSVDDKSIPNALEDMYLTKTLQRFKTISDDKRFKLFFKKGIKVNEMRYKSLDEVSEILKESVPKLLYDVKKFNIIHGDLCFSNIMVDNNFSFIKVIDPRGKFGKFDIYGDPRYELAKLFHSVDGKYDFIIKDLFTVNFDLEDCRIDYNINDRTREYDLYSIFIDVFKEAIGDDLQKIELIESLLFLSMVPLHGESIQHQMVMLATGLDILNRVVDITEEEK